MLSQISFKILCASAFVFAASLGAPQVQAQLQTKIVFSSLTDLDKCAAEYRFNTGYCLEPLENYAKKHPSELFTIGKRARLNFVHRVALRFFEPALQKPTPAQCEDDDLRMAVVSGFNTPPDNDDNKRAGRILSGVCFDALRPAIEREAISSGNSSYFNQTTCAVLAAKNVKSEGCSPQVAPAKLEPVAAPEKLPNVDKSKAALGLIKVYAGPEGERVTMADVKDMPGVYLIRLDGVRSPVNGKTFVHKEDAAGRNTTYWTEHDGQRWNTVFVQGSNYKQYTVFVPGTKTELRIAYSDAETKAAKAESLR
jgi:hypothetical protein